MQFEGKMPAALKFSVPIQDDGTIASEDDVSVGTKQISWNLIDTAEVLESPSSTITYSRVNQFVLSVMLLFDNFQVVADSNKIVLELEAAESAGE